jgi:protein-S-isoprenylcysteine O-methyltransferase Ste14
MRILDQFLLDGDRLFRWRSYFPLALVPVLVLGLASTPSPFATRATERTWEFFSVAVALAGLGLRVRAIGTAPQGTSERSTVNPRASELRTTGLYSVVRHPLYVGNGLMGIGLSLFPGIWYLPVITALLTLLYYERIAAREEAFLEGVFGDPFRRWANEVPAFMPSIRRYRPASLPFSWRKVLRHEWHGLLVIAAGAAVLDAVQESLRVGHAAADRWWLVVFAACAAIFVMMTTIKRTTSWLDIKDPDPASTLMPDPVTTPAGTPLHR